MAKKKAAPKTKKPAAAKEPKPAVEKKPEALPHDEKPVDVGAEITKDVAALQKKYDLSAGGFNVKSGKIVFRGITNAGIKLTGSADA
jgi:hypothetical protein